MIFKWQLRFLYTLYHTVIMLEILKSLHVSVRSNISKLANNIILGSRYQFSSLLTTTRFQFAQDIVVRHMPWCELFQCYDWPSLVLPILLLFMLNTVSIPYQQGHFFMLVTYKSLDVDYNQTRLLPLRSGLLCGIWIFKFSSKIKLQRIN